MRLGEQAELERQGAKAAARGELLESNPMLRATNMPIATGESLQDWALRRDAWKAGFVSQDLARWNPHADHH